MSNLVFLSDHEERRRHSGSRDTTSRDERQDPRESTKRHRMCGSPRCKGKQNPPRDIIVVDPIPNVFRDFTQKLDHGPRLWWNSENNSSTNSSLPSTLTPITSPETLMGEPVPKGESFGTFQNLELR